MSSPSVARALDELEGCGAKLTLEGGNIHIKYECPARSIQMVKNAISLLKTYKQEAIGCLDRRSRVDSKDTTNWPPASIDAQQRFGHHAARLYPFLNQHVRTALGIGKLVQVFRGRATVILEKEFEKPLGEQQESFFDPLDICPINLM